MSEKSSTILPGTVEKLIKSPYSDEPEKAQISVEGADHLYREIRIDNSLTNENGDEVSLKRGAHVEVTVEAAAEDTTLKIDEKVQQAAALQIAPLPKPEGSVPSGPSIGIASSIEG
jgi:hypothetical protein